MSNKYICINSVLLIFLFSNLSYIFIILFIIESHTIQQQYNLLYDDSDGRVIIKYII